MSWPSGYELRTQDVDEMWGRLDRARKSRIWFGDDVDLLNALCAAQDSLLTVVRELIAEQTRQLTVGEDLSATRGAE